MAAVFHYVPPALAGDDHFDEIEKAYGLYLTLQKGGWYVRRKALRNSPTGGMLEGPGNIISGPWNTKETARRWALGHLNFAELGEAEGYSDQEYYALVEWAKKNKQDAARPQSPPKPGPLPGPTETVASPEEQQAAANMAEPVKPPMSTGKKALIGVGIAAAALTLMSKP